MDDIKIELGQQIKAFRKKKKITQEELAKKIGSKQDYISKVESGSINITINSLTDMANALGADIKKILKVFS